MQIAAQMVIDLGATCRKESRVDSYGSDSYIPCPLRRTTLDSQQTQTHPVLFAVIIGRNLVFLFLEPRHEDILPIYCLKNHSVDNLDSVHISSGSWLLSQAQLSLESHD